MKAGLKKGKMFLIIILITLFHWIMAMLWFLFKEVKVENDYTGDFREYQRCHYPLTKNFRYDSIFKYR